MIDIKFLRENPDVVKENIKFPAVDKEHNYVVDTVMVARPAANL